MSIQEQNVRKQQVQSQINKLEKQLTHFPPGHIICIQNGKYIKMQHILDGKPTTISTKNQEFAKKLMQKKYLDVTPRSQRETSKSRREKACHWM